MSFVNNANSMDKNNIVENKSILDVNDPFNNWKEVDIVVTTEDLSPRALFTDSDPAILAAIQDIDSALKECLAPIPLSLQRAQMIQALLYQGLLIAIDKIKVKEPENDFEDAIEHMYDMPQHWIYSLPNPDSCWFKSIPSEISSYITIAQRIKIYTTQSLHYIDQICMNNVYISTVHKKVDKKIEFGSTMSIVKTSVQVAIVKDNEQNSLDNISNLPKITNLEYHKPRDRPPKNLKLSTKENNN
ncbi:hypothetical protein C2G38_2153365 [Gigaspora rosea]|uniref:Uncharacterized protein n=1 Tax=Gigaspora rosea TaxID=44941 RepID=A0A397W622_9GLOM|nr:hypothetical protein C2G38_2153365 [Gigaspora rosea]